MLRFSDFSLLPEVDELVRQLVGEQSGLIVVTGLDARPAAAEGDDDPDLHFLPSGRATIFRVLAGELLNAHPDARGLFMAEDRDILLTARRFRRNLQQVQVKPPLTYAEALGDAGQFDVIIVDRLSPDNLPSLLAAAQAGALVLSQMDTLFHSQAVVGALADLCPAPDDLAALRWVLSVQRLPTLCPICKQPVVLSADQVARLEWLRRRFPALEADGGSEFYAPGTCDTCNNSGRRGDVAVFDFLRLDGTGGDGPARPSAMPMEAYIRVLAERGLLALSDVLEFESRQLHRTYRLLAATQRRLNTTTAELERNTIKLDTTGRLLKQRTRELVALEGIGRTLITWSDLRELGDRVLKTALELSKADRGILYYIRSAQWGQILAARGWREAQIEMGISCGTIHATLSSEGPTAYEGTPPGLTLLADTSPSRAGQAIPLRAHGIPVGMMLIQSTRKPRFTQGEVAILQTLAGYAAVAMQRAEFIDQLRIKISELEEAQDELAQKERLERELELARQVQLSMIPRAFPAVPGITFAASYEPARQVGGDFYDVIPLDDGRIALIIADVADKGLPAALYMAQTRSLIQAVARHSDTPAETLQRVNGLLRELGEQDMFVTVFYAIMDKERRRLTYVRAGHEHPFLVRDGRVLPLGGRGMVLGLFDSPAFMALEESLELQAGDKLVLYTDGLTDVINPAGEMPAHDRLAALVAAHAVEPPAGMCRALFADLTAWRGSAAQFDDMALLVVGVE